MAKTKNKVVIVIACLMLAVLCAVVLAACGGTETYTVTFMVRENGTRRTYRGRLYLPRLVHGRGLQRG